jgi:uncharacterized integral membrane protein
MQRNQSVSFWGFIVSALIVVIFAVQNAQEVGFKFFIWRTHLSLSVLLIVAFLLGLIVGAIFSFRQSRNQDNANSSDQKHSAKKEPEQHNPLYGRTPEEEENEEKEEEENKHHS